MVDNPFPIIAFLQTGSLFLGKYEIIEPPVLLQNVSSNYKRKYKHAILNVKPMLEEAGRLTFELIALTGMQGDRSFRQNYFREIVLKNKLSKDQVDEFGELPGGILYKKIIGLQKGQFSLESYLQQRQKRTSKFFNNKKGSKLVCISEREAIDLGMRLLQELETLHNFNVLHSNIHPSSVYLRENDISQLAFIDLELAIWEQMQILNTESTYFQQLPEDKYDIAFRDARYLSPEHIELAEEYRRSSRIPKQDITQQCDLYSIAAIMFRAITGLPPAQFSYETEDHPALTQTRNMLSDWEIPSAFKNLCISNGMCNFLIRGLAKSTSIRHKSIADFRKDLVKLKEDLNNLPEILLQGLEHVETTADSMFEDHYILDLRDKNLTDFSLEYLNKFILESRVPNLRIFGGCLPLSALKENRIQILDLSNQKIFAEDSRILAYFLSVNSSLKVIDLSKNPLAYRAKQYKDNEPTDIKNAALEIGVEELINALSQHSNLIEIRLAYVEIGQNLSEKLSNSIKLNTHLELIDLSYCNMGAIGSRSISRLCISLINLAYLNFSGNNIGDEGAINMAKVLEVHTSLKELYLDSNNITNAGAEALAQVLTNNFILQKLSILDNHIDTKENDLLVQSVAFNSHYLKLKASNERYGEYAHNLIGESIKRWVLQNKHVIEKLKARLSKFEDELDSKLADILIDSQGNLNLRPIPLKYTYNPGEGTVYFESK
jgi:serine/threonine protein kinase